MIRAISHRQIVRGGTRVGALWVIALVAGVVLLVSGGTKIIRERSWINKAARAEGVVVELVPQRSGGKRQRLHTYYRPRVAFTAADGTKHVCFQTSAAGNSYSMGQHVRVVYDRTTYEGRILTFEERFGSAVIFSAIGIGIVFAAVAFLAGKFLFTLLYPGSTGV